MTPALFGDVTVECRMITGLVHAWVQPQVADQLLRAGETGDVADRSQDAGSDDGIHSTDRHESLHVRLIECPLRQVLVDHQQLGGESVEFIEVTQHQAFLIDGHGQLFEPGTPLLGEEVAGLTRNQVGMQDGLNPVLQPSRLRNKLGAFGDAPALGLDRFGRYPDFRQEPRGVQSGENRSIDLVGLDLRPGDGPHLQRVGYDYAMDKRRQKANDDRRVAGGFQHHVVVPAKLFAELKHCLAIHGEATVVSHRAVLQDGDLSEGPMNIKSDYSHLGSSYSEHITAGARGSHDNYGFALAAHPGESKGRPDNNSSSQLIVNFGLPARHAPVAPIPALRRYPCRNIVHRREARE